MDRQEATEVLGVNPDADREEIETRYRELVRTVHPDQGGSTESFKRVRTAKSVLSAQEANRRGRDGGHRSTADASSTAGGRSARATGTAGSASEWGTEGHTSTSATQASASGRGAHTTERGTTPGDMLDAPMLYIIGAPLLWIVYLVEFGLVTAVVLVIADIPFDGVAQPFFTGEEELYAWLLSGLAAGGCVYTYFTEHIIAPVST
jgi:hypothetical protein